MAAVDPQVSGLQVQNEHMDRSNMTGKLLLIISEHVVRSLLNRGTNNTKGCAYLLTIQSTTGVHFSPNLVLFYFFPSIHLPVSVSFETKSHHVAHASLKFSGILHLYPLKSWEYRQSILY